MIRYATRIMNPAKGREFFHEIADLTGVQDHD